MAAINININYNWNVWPANLQRSTLSLSAGASTSRLATTASIPTPSPVSYGCLKQCNLRKGTCNDFLSFWRRREVHLKRTVGLDFNHSFLPAKLQRSTQLLVAGGLTARLPTTAWIPSASPVSFGLLRQCSYRKGTWHWRDLHLQREWRCSKQGRHKRGLIIQSDASSQRTGGDEAVTMVTGNVISAASTVPKVKEGKKSTSIVEKRNLAVISEYPDKKAVKDTFLSITVLGATGDLAQSKIFPALFALYISGHLPKSFAIFGYSRSQLTDDDLRDLISESLTCRVDEEANCGEEQETFLQKVFFQSGGYESCENLKTLDSRMKELEGDGIANRVFYLSVPQDVVLVVASCLSESAQSEAGWTRLIVEKPFGNDSESSRQITEALLSGFNEEQIYRIDHLLGRELIENLTVLRFSNLVFEPLWCRTYIRNVQFIYSEDCGVAEGKGGYFDEQGVIRDLVQSHLLQTIALFAMEPPVTLDGEDIRNEKVKVLRSMRKPTYPSDVVLGQYKASFSKDGKSKIRGYLDEPEVSSKSLTPTFVATIFYIDNARWDGVPFFIKAGKGLNKHKVEIRIQFHAVPGNLYLQLLGYNKEASMNELILQVQPDEGIFLKINNKVPGYGTHLGITELNLHYGDNYDIEVPDTYERLILDVIIGDNHLFLRADELAETWNLLSPLLSEIESSKAAPEFYTFGGRGPIGAYYLGARHGVKWVDE